MPSPRFEYEKGESERLTSLFKNHKVVRASDRHWLIQSHYEDGTPKSEYYTEIVALYSRQLVVTGDIDAVVFAYGPADPVERVHWIGKCMDLDYVASKAKIGTSLESHNWIRSVARTELDQLQQDGELELTNKDALDDVHHAGDQDEFLRAMADAFGETYYEYYCSLGEVVSHRVLMAHAAVRRLSQLIELPLIVENVRQE